MALWAVGRNLEGQLLLGREEEGFTTPCEVNTLTEDDEVSHVACGRNFTVILLSDGSVLSGGENNCGQLGHGTDQPTDVFSEEQNTKSDKRNQQGETPLYAYQAHRPPLMMEATDGHPIHGEMSGCSASINFPRPIDSLSGKLALMVACGAQHTLVLVRGADGNEVFAFGSNVDGELGLGAGELGRGSRCHHVTEPTLVTTLLSEKVKSIACGSTFSLAVTRGGVLYAWGNNVHGQLALGHTKSVDVPQSSRWLAQERCVQVSAGAFHAVLLCKSGKVFSAGRNNKGLLGTGLRGGPPCWPVPQLVEPLLGKNILSVHCGVAHSAALGMEKRRGRRRVYTWGSNSHGQLGLGGVALGADVLRAKPVEYLLNRDVSEVACGSFHTLVITAHGQLLSWGDNRHGQLGVVTLKSHAIGDTVLHVPQPAAGPKTVSINSPLFSAEVSSRNLRAAGSGQAAGLVSMTQTYGTDHFRVKRDANWVDPVKELGTKFFHSQVGLSTVGVNLEKQLSSGDVLLVGAGGGEREGDEERDELEQAAPLEEEEEEEEDDGTEIKGGVIGEWERMCVWAGGSHSVVGLRRKLRCELDPGVSGGGPQVNLKSRMLEDVPGDRIASLGRDPVGVLKNLTEEEEGEHDSVAWGNPALEKRASLLEF